ncbi:Hypothetical protein SRAE_X000044800 [Strongyloides ratti]|uniref:Uncharacterized protein n=1 Tax=Strongyloides ratti TaxID=34506 RepID=A0A090LMZ9_STRRB|nr:Hypothetical protein SRAE_X000044800 [Strongyloides ratti]CEF71121.1 Hypothetical protein SRAE_X000044800 [Strongyloides ratti]
MHSYNQTLLFLRLLFCVIILSKVISGESYDNFNEDDETPFSVSIKHVRSLGARELFGKRSNQIGSSSYIFGRHSRRGRELFGKRSSPLTGYLGIPDDQVINGFYNKRTRARELLGKRSEIINDNNFNDDLLQNDKRRARELLGKRSYMDLFQIAPGYFDSSEEILNMKPQFENLYEVKRGRTRELFGR